MRDFEKNILVCSVAAISLYCAACSSSDNTPDASVDSGRDVVLGDVTLDSFVDANDANPGDAGEGGCPAPDAAAYPCDVSHFPRGELGCGDWKGLAETNDAGNLVCPPADNIDISGPVGNTCEYSFDAGTVCLLPARDDNGQPAFDWLTPQCDASCL